MKKIIYGVFLSVLLSGVCTARLMMVIGAGSDASLNYFFADHTCVESLPKDIFGGTTQTHAYLKGELCTEGVQKSLEKIDTVEEHIIGPGEFRGTVSLWMPDRASQNSINRHWTGVVRMLLDEVRSVHHTEDIWRLWKQKLALGAATVASHIADIARDLEARSIINGVDNPLAKYSFVKAGTPFLGGGQPFAILSMQRPSYGQECNEEGEPLIGFDGEPVLVRDEDAGDIGFIDANLAREALGTQCRVMIHESGTHALIHSWLRLDDVTARIIRAGGNCVVRGNRFRMFLPDGMPPVAGFAQAAALLGSLAEACYKVDSFDAEASFKDLSRAAIECAEEEAKSNPSGSYGLPGRDKVVAPPSPTDKDGPKAGPPSVSPLTIPPHVEDWDAPDALTGSPKHRDDVPLLGAGGEGKKKEKKSSWRFGWGRKGTKKETPPGGDDEGVYARLLDDGQEGKK